MELNHKLGGTFCSQPPLLSAMVHAIYSRTGDMQLVRKSLPALLKEYHFWNSGTMIYIYILFRWSLNRLFFVFKWTYVYISSLASFFVAWTFLTISFSAVVGIHKVTIQDAQSCNHTLNRYYAMWNKPRPESSTIVCPSI